MEPIVLVNDDNNMTQETQTIVSENKGGLEDFFSSYKESIKVPNPEHVEVPINSGIKLPNENDIPLNSELRFRRGEKKGQLKPNWKDLYSKQSNPSINSGPANPSINSGQAHHDTIKENAVITGAVLLILIDVVLPEFVAMIGNKYVKKKGEKKIESKQIKLTNEQRRDLSPLADAAAKHLNVDANPVVLFAIALVGVYTSNLISNS